VDHPPWASPRSACPTVSGGGCPSGTVPLVHTDYADSGGHRSGRDFADYGWRIPSKQICVICVNLRNLRSAPMGADLRGSPPWASPRSACPTVSGEGGPTDTVPPVHTDYADSEGHRSGRDFADYGWRIPSKQICVICVICVNLRNLRNLRSAPMGADLRGSPPLGLPTLSLPHRFRGRLSLGHSPPGSHRLRRFWRSPLGKGFRRLRLGNSLKTNLHNLR